MARVLILSSFVVASRVGGGAQALALARLGIEPVLVPTVLFGRHPGHGPPGGGPVAAETFAAMLGGIEAHGGLEGLAAVITGHFSLPEQVAIAAETLDKVRAASPGARLIVDPVMGDEGTGLYVREAVATAIAETLVPRADIVAPNAWELARLTGQAAGDAAGAMLAARLVGRPVLVSSVWAGGDIGAIYAEEGSAWLATHAPQDAAPKGTGDLLTAVFAAGLIRGLGPSGALHAAVSAVADAVAAADGDELAVSAMPTELRRSASVRLEALDG
jgi:pyridoxine kinase